jgi:hypothetical protein
MVGQSAVATVQAYVYDATSADLGNIQTQPEPPHSLTRSRCSLRRVCPAESKTLTSGSPSIRLGWK